MGLWSWITGDVTAIASLTPVVADGEAVLVALEKVIADIKAGNIDNSIADTAKVAADVAVFAAEVQKVIGSFVPANTKK